MLSMLSPKAEYDVLLTHNNVRWLSKGKSLQRIWAIRHHLIEFPATVGNRTTQAAHYHEMLMDDKKMEKIAFLTDMFRHLNDLNLQLQGEGKSIIALWSTVRAFKTKLGMFVADVAGERHHFPALQSCTQGTDINYQSMLQAIKSEFDNRIAHLMTLSELLQLIASPNSCGSQWVKKLHLVGLESLVSCIY